MQLIYTLFYFLGSVYFAILLIASAALFVTAGTLIEAWSGSHLYAAEFTYSHPLFNFLLSLFFLNILISALRRWPFQTKHIPFLITHAGLLMILAGVIIKNRYGTQGIMTISEGSASQTILLPHTHALNIEDRTGGVFLFPNEQPENVKIRVAASTPHVEEKWKSWIKNGAVTIAGQPLIPVHSWEPKDPWPEMSKANFTADSKEWHIVALKTKSTEDAIKRAALEFLKYPLLLIVEDLQGTPSLYAFDSNGAIFHKSFNQEDLLNLTVYDKGFAGYGVDAHLPQSLINNENVQLSGPLKFMQEASLKTDLCFEDCLFNFIRDPLEYKDTHFLNALNWPSLPKFDYQGCYWSALLFNQLAPIIKEKMSIREHLIKNNCPLKIPETDNNRLILISLAEQLFASAPYLPKSEIIAPKTVEEQIMWLMAYLYAYGITYETLIPPIQKEFSGPFILLETSLVTEHRSSPPLDKLEENRPGIKIEITKGDRKEIATLAYDATAQGLKWPILNGEFLLRYQPEWRQIPYKIRLREARQIRYSNSDQTYSYECDCLINGEEVTLSMNRVHQTWDGYRFYLSGMSTHRDQLKQVQIVVNRDPVKYYLTYPGGFVVALGSILLFWGKSIRAVASRFTRKRGPKN